jgi:hypothetical protein
MCLNCSRNVDVESCVGQYDLCWVVCIYSSSMVIDDNGRVRIDDSALLLQQGNYTALISVPIIVFGKM